MLVRVITLIDVDLKETKLEKEQVLDQIENKFGDAVRHVEGCTTRYVVAEELGE